MSTPHLLFDAPHGYRLSPVRAVTVGALLHGSLVCYHLLTAAEQASILVLLHSIMASCRADHAISLFLLYFFSPFISSLYGLVTFFCIFFLLVQSGFFVFSL